MDACYQQLMSLLASLPPSGSSSGVSEWWKQRRGIVCALFQCLTKQEVLRDFADIISETSSTHQPCFRTSRNLRVGQNAKAKRPKPLLSRDHRIPLRDQGRDHWRNAHDPPEPFGQQFARHKFVPLRTYSFRPAKERERELVTFGLVRWDSHDSDRDCCLFGGETSVVLARGIRPTLSPIPAAATTVSLSAVPPTAALGVFRGPTVTLPPTAVTLSPLATSATPPPPPPPPPAIAPPPAPARLLPRTGVLRTRYRGGPTPTTTTATGLQPFRWTPPPPRSQQQEIKGAIVSRQPLPRMSGAAKTAREAIIDCVTKNITDLDTTITNLTDQLTDTQRRLDEVQSSAAEQRKQGEAAAVVCSEMQTRLRTIQEALRTATAAAAKDACPPRADTAPPPPPVPARSSSEMVRKEVERINQGRKTTSALPEAPEDQKGGFWLRNGQRYTTTTLARPPFAGVPRPQLGAPRTQLGAPRPNFSGQPRPQFAPQRRAGPAPPSASPPTQAAVQYRYTTTNSNNGRPGFQMGRRQGGYGNEAFYVLPQGF
jgi:hypothetical protein